MNTPVAGMSLQAARGGGSVRMDPKRPSSARTAVVVVGAVVTLALGITVGHPLAQPAPGATVAADLTGTPIDTSTPLTTPPETTTTSLTPTTVAAVTTVAPPTTKLAARPTAPPPTAPASTLPARVTANGILEVGVVLSDALTLPTECKGFMTSWQIQVRDGGTSVLALGQIKSATMTKRTLTNGVLSMTCRFNYSVSLPRGPVFTFQVVQASDNRQIDASVTVTGDSAAAGQAPLLTLTFCPECRK